MWVGGKEFEKREDNMAALTPEKVITTGCPRIEVVRLEATDADTYQTRKFRFIDGAILALNKDRDTTVNVENSDSAEVDGTDDTVILNSPSLDADTVTLIIFGRR